MLLNHVSAERSQIDIKRYCGKTRALNIAMQTVFENSGYLLNRIEEGYFNNPTENAYKYVLETKT